MNHETKFGGQRESQFDKSNEWLTQPSFVGLVKFVVNISKRIMFL